jgi:hypothetical protein
VRFTDFDFICLQGVSINRRDLIVPSSVVVALLCPVSVFGVLVFSVMISYHQS